MSNPDLSLPEFKVPGISGYTPPFGTKKPDGESLTTEEVVKNLELMSLGDIKVIQVTGSNYQLSIPHLVSDVVFNVPSSYTNVIITLNIGKARVGAKVIVHLDRPRDFQLSVKLNSPSVSKNFLFQNYSCWMVTFLGSELVVQNTDIHQSSQELKQRLIALESKNRNLETKQNTQNQKILDIQDFAGQMSLTGSGEGRNLANVLSTRDFDELLSEVHTDISGDEGFHNLAIGDYYDIPALAIDGNAYSGTTQHHTLRIVISGFNLFRDDYGRFGKPHVLWTFRNVVLKRPMHTNSSNSGGYPVSELSSFLENKFFKALKTITSESTAYFYSVRRVLSTKTSFSDASRYVFIPTEVEVFGQSFYGDDNKDYRVNIQFPLYRDSIVHRIKKHNGVNTTWWTGSCHKNSTSHYCAVSSVGYHGFESAQSTGVGVSPAFCTC